MNDRKRKGHFEITSPVLLGVVAIGLTALAAVVGAFAISDTFAPYAIAVAAGATSLAVSTFVYGSVRLARDEAQLREEIRDQHADEAEALVQEIEAELGLGVDEIATTTHRRDDVDGRRVTS